MSSSAPIPLRSALFVPAANARALEKSAELPADALIFDLEDSAAEGEKAEARERLRRHLGHATGNAKRVVRVNAAGEPGAAADLRLAAESAGLHAVLLPKVESPATLQAADEALRAAGAADDLALWAMVETPRGILCADAIAGAPLSRPLGALVVGPNDIALATGVKPSEGRPELLPWLMSIVLAAKAHGLLVLDGVYNDFRDAQGLAAECRQGRRLGFCGKTLIHPAQIEAANAAFAPDAQEVARAETIVAAFREPGNASRGVVQIEGRMVERLHLREAEALLALHHAIEGTRR